MRQRVDPLTLEVVVERLRELGLAGVTVLRAIESPGAHGRLYGARCLRLAEDLRFVIGAVNRDERP